MFLDKEVPRDAAIDVLHASLAHVRPDAADLAGRFDQWKHAILKNGWIVSQFKESPNSDWKDRPPSPIINPATNTPTGLYFLKSLLSDDKPDRQLEMKKLTYYGTKRAADAQSGS